MKTRTEFDSIGSMEVPANAYYGVQSLRAMQNFQISGRKLHGKFIESLAVIKKAAALTNYRAGHLEAQRTHAIMRSCDEVMDGKYRDQFIVDAIQGGAGTSANMNANEVIANRAIELMHGDKGDYSVVHPNDHVNMAQSTNDVIPSAGKLTVLKLMPGLLHELDRLENALLDKSREFDHILKMGRTQLQDCCSHASGPVIPRLCQCDCKGYSSGLKVTHEMYILNMGGTAIGTAINVSPDYLHHIVDNLG